MEALNTADLLDMVISARKDAEFFIGKRRKDIELYALIGKVQIICEIAQGTTMQSALEKAVVEKTKALRSSNRAYFEKDADIFRIVGRYVFGPLDRNSGWRYAATIREAHKRGIAGKDLPRWLSENGGLNALFRARPTSTKQYSGKTLFLRQAISFEPDTPFTITLIRRSDGLFDVVEK